MLILVVSLLVLVSGCQDSKRREYYQETDNYITAVGTVSHISFNEQTKSLYIGFSDTVPTFDDTCVKIVGESFDIVKERGIEEKLHMGDSIEFAIAPKYFGDGYVMPIVSITVGGEELLAFDEGYANLLEWLETE